MPLNATLPLTNVNGNNVSLQIDNRTLKVEDVTVENEAGEQTTQTAIAAK